ncbi:MAG TPA: hypothetical protein VJZ49_02165 [Syntrophales bacterium]|nr:hypothetical protein [Syntrophales bacterium]
MQLYKRLVLLMTALMLTLVFIGCARPPQAEKAAAKTAMDAALSAGADKYAAADFAAARKLWDASEAQVKEKKYEEAKNSYIEARVAFEKAAGGVEAGKKAMTAEAEAAVARLEEGWVKLEAAEKKIEKKLEKKNLWEIDAKTFVEGLKAAKDMITADPAGAKAKADTLKPFLDSYGAVFEQLAAAPAKSQGTKKKASTVED